MSEYIVIGTIIAAFASCRVDISLSAIKNL